VLLCLPSHALANIYNQFVVSKEIGLSTVLFKETTLL
jgi:hypothetical protein